MGKQLFIVVMAIIPLIGYCQEETLTGKVLDQLSGEQMKMFEAFCDGDSESFEEIAGSDYRTINADGSYMDKDQTLEYIKKFKGATYKIIEQTDRVYDNVVISTGRAKFYFGFMLAADVYFTQVWILRDKWEFISWQGTPTGITTYYTTFLTLLVLVALVGVTFLIKKLLRRRNV